MNTGVNLLGYTSPDHCKDLRLGIRGTGQKTYKKHLIFGLNGWILELMTATMKRTEINIISSKEQPSLFPQAKCGIVLLLLENEAMNT